MKCILIADAGSTKTKWSFHSDEIPIPLRLYSLGINPAHDSDDIIKENLRSIRKQLPYEFINEIHFFGAGCASTLLKQSLKSCFEETFNFEQLHIESDLLGAAIALFNDGEGIACILGTGSNSGLYSSGSIKYKIPSLGYILGDEGSGVALGKSLLNSIFKKQLSNDIIKLFYDSYQLSEIELVEKVYCKPKPASFLASFSPFLLKNIEKGQIRELVEKEFVSFFIKNILPYKNVEKYEIGFVGSIASNYKDILLDTASKFNLTIKKIVSGPILELENYYFDK